MAVKKENFRDAANKLAKKQVLASGWTVYRDFEIEESDNDVHVYAPRKAPEIPSQGGMQAIHSAWMAEDLNRVRVYAPLRDTPDLFLEFASLGRKEGVTRDKAAEVMLDWVKSFGTLGLEDAGDRAESLLGFSLAVRKAARCLELYEAATADLGRRGDPDVAVLDAYGAFGRTLKEKREWALQEVTSTVGRRVKMGCYPQLYRKINREVDQTVGFEQGWAFRSLLGAMYLQMMWLMTEGGDAPRCEGPGCNRFIRIGEGGGDGEDLGLRKNSRPRRYRTRKDKRFCSRNCKEKYRYHNVIKLR